MSSSWFGWLLMMSSSWIRCAVATEWHIVISLRGGHVLSFTARPPHSIRSRFNCVCLVYWFWFQAFFMMEESTPVLLEDLQKTEFTKNKIKSTSQRRGYSEINPCVLAKDQKLHHASHNATGWPNVLSVKTDRTISNRYNGIIKKISVLEILKSNRGSHRWLFIIFFLIGSVELTKHS